VNMSLLSFCLQYQFLFANNFFGMSIYTTFEHDHQYKFILSSSCSRTVTFTLVLRMVLGHQMVSKRVPKST